MTGRGLRGTRGQEGRGSRGIRGVFLLVHLVATLVPGPRRRDWIEQWRGELFHYDQWLRREGAGGFVQSSWVGSTSR